MEESYSSFAWVYDLFMDNIDYPAWCEYLSGLLKKNGIEDGLILELGCGTGSMTELLADKGYDMIGIDNSEDMLEICRTNMKLNDKQIMLFTQKIAQSLATYLFFLAQPTLRLTFKTTWQFVKCETMLTDKTIVLKAI